MTDKIEYKGEFYTKDELIDVLMEEIYELERDNEDLQSEIDNMKENYVPRQVDPYEEYGLSQSDFI